MFERVKRLLAPEYRINPALDLFSENAAFFGDEAEVIPLGPEGFKLKSLECVVKSSPVVQKSVEFLNPTFLNFTEE